MIIKKYNKSFFDNKANYKILFIFNCALNCNNHNCLLFRLVGPNKLVSAANDLNKMVKNPVCCLQA